MAIAPCGKDLGVGNYFCMSPEWSADVNAVTGHVEYRQFIRYCITCWSIWYFRHLMAEWEKSRG